MNAPKILTPLIKRGQEDGISQYNTRYVLPHATQRAGVFVHPSCVLLHVSNVPCHQIKPAASCKYYCTPHVPAISVHNNATQHMIYRQPPSRRMTTKKSSKNIERQNKENIAEKSHPRRPCEKY